VVAIAAALLATAGALAFVAVRGPEPARGIRQQTREVASTLRCPVCRDLSVEDSPSLVARQMRATIARRLRAGRSPDEIRDYFVSRFGSSVLLTPQGAGIDLLAWLIPVLLIAAGLMLVGGAVRTWSRRGNGAERAASEPSLDPLDRIRLDEELRDIEEPGWA
jgi:cytochrome c-type biogenesis protein CcmH